MGACSKEHPFSPENSAEGQVLKSALDVSTSSDNIEITKAPTRAGYSIDDFNIAFMRPGNTTPVKSFKFGEMPNIVNLASGNYTVEASYGEDKIAEWENPYFTGSSQQFEVKPMEITSYIDPIECSLQNVKVTIEYDASLFSKMGSDASVEVKVGDNDGLSYGKSEKRAGYFRHTEEMTLVATFRGTIDGSLVVETKSYSGVQKGCWYKLKFKLHGGNGSGTGNASGSLSVDASVDVEDVNADVVIAEDEPLDDNERPQDGDDPNEPDPPTPPTPSEGPEFIAESQGLVFDTPITVTETTQCKFKIVCTSDGGFTGLTCDIISPQLDGATLESVELRQHLDLVNTPEDIINGLDVLGFPYNMGGDKEATFDLTEFLMPLSMLGAGPHEFKITATDANGTTVKSIILQY